MHLSSSSTFLFFKLSFVGRIWLQALHKKVFAAFGILKPQIFFHMAFVLTDVGRLLQELLPAKTIIPSRTPFDPEITFDPGILGKQFFLSRVAKPCEETSNMNFTLITIHGLLFTWSCTVYGHLSSLGHFTRMKFLLLVTLEGTVHYRVLFTRALFIRALFARVLFTRENTVHPRILPLNEPFPQRTTLPAKDSVHPSTSEHIRV